MKISIIVATSENNAIGKNNQLIWHLPDDFKYFKNKTKGHHIISGRKNFESIGRALPDRTNIIITRNTNYVADNCIVVNSIENALQKVKNDDETFIIGGGEIYKQTLPITDIVYLTRVHTKVDADVFFPELTPGEWKLVESNHHPKDEKHCYDFTFEKYVRVKNE